jgi:hypothetical protein
MVKNLRKKFGDESIEKNNKLYNDYKKRANNTAEDYSNIKMIFILFF